MVHQSAFAGKNPMLKGALHTHTTRSDGNVMPADLLAQFEAQGYNFVALTDHRIYNHDDFGNKSLTIIPGMEMDRNFDDEGIHCFHAVSIGPSIEDGNGFVQDQLFERGIVRDQFEFQPVLDMLHANNNLTFYCHPEWSSTPARQFEKLTGNFAMEVWNTGCAYENYCDRNAAYWDELLMQGQKIYGVATDDCHHMKHAGKGWVMVNSENTVPAILQALKAGAFYSSCGPIIHDFHIENDEAVVECSPCQHIAFRYGQEPTRLKQNPDGLITKATFKIPSYFKYLRIIVMDDQGRRAWSNPIFRS